MIIRSIRLKNIKSYGEGANGEGITIEFTAGINRIAGRNGHGKSTLIESLGYALFLTPPLFEENVQVVTYLLRAGQKAGEIDVTFEEDGEIFRIERGLGIRNTRRSKIVQLSDGSIAAEGDDEVSAFLCRLLGCPGPERLSELFAKLVGVKQGRLAWPFDSKPTEARKHFEPLLDVEIFRQCFERLKPVVDEFSGAAQREATQLAAITERMRDRQDAPERVRIQRLEIEQLTTTLTSARAAWKLAEEEKLRWEVVEKARNTLLETHEKARGEVELAKTHRAHAEERLAESLRAKTAVAQTEADYGAYLVADRALAGLHQQQGEKARLEKKRAEAHARRVEYDAKAAAAKAFADDCEKRRADRECRAAELAKEASDLGKKLAETKSAFELEMKSIRQMRADEEVMRHWIRGLPEKTTRLCELGATVDRTRQAIVTWDVALLVDARAKEQSSGKSLEECQGQLSAIAEVNRSLKQQLEEISEGVCPFLKDRCNQFDQAKVAGDLRGREANIAALTDRVRELRESHRVTKAEVERLTAAEAKLGHLRADFDGRMAELRQQGTLLISSEIIECCERLGLHSPMLPGELNGSIDTWLTGVREFSATACKAFDGIAPGLMSRFEVFENTRNRRLGEEHHFASLEKDSALIKKEALALTEEVAAKRKETEAFHSQSAIEGKAVAELESALQAFASLDARTAEEQQRKTLHAAAHQRYIAAKPQADKLDERLQALEKLKGAEVTSNQRFEDLAQQLRITNEAFDPVAFENARKALSERSAENHIAEERLGHARRQLERDEERLREFEKALAGKSKIEIEISRIEAAIELTEKARGILKNAAPHVAQHLCQRIAARAQQVFNHINHEPAELEWTSERYGLRIHPGDRRFAMLSGGEQTKLALAMTLAMIQEFCGLKFCVFDEPTYGVDGESRVKLAEAILAAQEAAGFDQLLLVSHDDAFDGRIEHTVRVSKSSAGTQQITE